MRNIAQIVTSVFIITLLGLSINVNAANNEGRLGVGTTNQLMTSLPAISFKIQKARAFSLGGLFGVNTDDDGGWGAGVKLYRILFDEPQLNFYGAILGALLNRKMGAGGEDESGFQFDLTLGCEFHFVGLSSLGFSFETGISVNKLDDFVIETVGQHFVTAAVHFYL
ncbi:MAG: hypothetical protein KAQ98_04250 [Bacteriovoracaceae bacterium]|nr:hypothetical protein [Bacteriovoracaceae bacterium]